MNRPRSGALKLFVLLDHSNLRSVHSGGLRYLGLFRRTFKSVNFSKFVNGSALCLITVIKKKERKNIYMKGPVFFVLFVFLLQSE